MPRFQALAGELIDNFAEPDRCEFVGEFAEPYSARVIAIMLGLPEDEWRSSPPNRRPSAWRWASPQRGPAEDRGALARLYEYL